MPFGKYELAENWYETKILENNDDKVLTFVQMVDLGLYERQNNVDSPQDARLEKIDALNTLFIIKKLFELVGINTDAIDNLSDRINQTLALDGSRAMTGDLNMGAKKITNLADPVDPQDAITKKYLEEHGSSEVDDTNYMFVDGSKSMTGDLNMDNHKAINLADPVDPQDVVNYRTLIQAINSLEVDISNTYLALNGSKAMTGNLDMGTKKIINLADPVNDQDAVTKKYLEEHGGNGGGGSGLVSQGTQAERDALESPSSGDIFVVNEDEFKRSYAYDGVQWVQIGEFLNITPTFEADIEITDANTVITFE